LEFKRNEKESKSSSFGNAINHSKARPCAYDRQTLPTLEVLLRFPVGTCQELNNGY
jgi:hypothetical protein